MFPHMRSTATGLSACFWVKDAGDFGMQMRRNGSSCWCGAGSGHLHGQLREVRGHGVRRHGPGHLHHGGTRHCKTRPVQSGAMLFTAALGGRDFPCNLRFTSSCPAIVSSLRQKLRCYENEPKLPPPYGGPSQPFAFLGFNLQSASGWHLQPVSRIQGGRWQTTLRLQNYWKVFMQGHWLLEKEQHPS